MRYYFWRFVHNSLVHPLIGTIGEWDWVWWLHEWTGNKWESYREETVDNREF